MNTGKAIKGIFAAAFGIVLIAKNSYADVVFPAIAHQFMVSMVIPSYYSVLMAILILLIEALFIRKLFAVNFIIGFILSLIVNLISSIAGVFIVSLLEVPTRELFKGIFGYADMRLGTYLGMVPGYILTVLIESVLLLFIAFLIRKKITIGRCMKTSAIMNCYSYLIILFGVVIADILTKGANFKTY